MAPRQAPSDLESLLPMALSLEGEAATETPAKAEIEDGAEAEEEAMEEEEAYAMEEEEDCRESSSI